MANYTADKSVHKTLTGTAIDKVTLAVESEVWVINRAPNGSSDMAATFSDDGDDPDDPVLLADDTELIPPGGFVTFRSGRNQNAIVKVIGNGNAYSVIGEPA